MLFLGVDLTRRQCLGGLGAAGLTAAMPGAARAYAPGVRLAFDVYRNGNPFGRHEVRFSRRGEETVIDISIELVVKAAFVTFFQYRHTNREVWRGGRLVQISTRTNDNGKAHALEGAAEQNAFVFESALGRQSAAPGIVPTSYWNPITTQQQALLDTQRGRIITVSVAATGERLQTAGGLGPARKYAMTGDLNLDLWYTDQGEWAKCAFEARGSKVEYRLVQAPTAAP